MMKHITTLVAAARSQQRQKSMKTPHSRSVMFLVVLFALASAGLVDAAVIWNADQAKTKEVYCNGSNGTGFNVSADPIDLGAWSDSGYVPVPYFTMKMSGYSSGAQIASVDALSLTLPNLSFIAGDKPFGANLYVWKGSPGNPDIATTGVVTTADWQWANLADPATATLLQALFIPQGSSPGTFALNAAGKTALLSYLQGNYVTDNYVTFTMRMSNAVITGSDGLIRLTGPATGLTSALQTTAIPEPASAVLVLVGVCGVLARRRTPKA